MIKIHEPDWMKPADDDSYVGAKEVLSAFGFHHKDNASRLVKDGHIPHPTKKQESQFENRSGKHTPRLMWKVKDLREVFDK